MNKDEKISRWRLILGSETDKNFNIMGFEGLSKEQYLIDNALATIYGTDKESFDISSKKSKNKLNSSPNITKWLGDLRNLFDKDIIKIIQNDAIDRKGLKELLLEPEILENIEPDINMASMLLLLKEQIPEISKDSARKFIKKIVEDINKKIESDIKRAVSSSLNKRNHSPIPLASAIDFKYTISRNLKNYNTDLKLIIPEKVYFYDRSNKTSKWNIILDIDQSASMGESIIYSSIISCILASISAIKTNVVAFDTEIMDLSDLCQDPVDLLFGFQMSGGTDIEKSVAYCQQLIEIPNKTLFFLISDLEEGGNRAKLLNRLEYMKSSGVIVIVLLAISDRGQPYYDEIIAKKIAKMNIPCFACTPERFAELLEYVLQKKDLNEFFK